MAAIRVIKVPDVGEGIAEVELVAWHVQPGDIVAEDQALADVMTDKASVEIPSPVAGRVQALGGAVGTMLAVGAELIRIELADAGAVRKAAAPAASADAAQAVARPAAPSASPPSMPPSTPGSPPPATPAPALPTRPPAPAPATPAAAATAPRRPIASPAVRRRAWELGLRLEDVAATGTAGRTMQADLEAHVALHGAPAHGPSQGPAAAGPAIAPLASPPAAPPTTPRHTERLAERHDEQSLPVIGLRRRIALQMQESKRRIPHFSYVEEVDVTDLETTRAALNAGHAAERGRLTLLPLLMRALVLAVHEFPQVNARFDDEAGVVTRHGAVHIGVATDTKHGLMVPVLRHAEALDVWALAAELVRLAEAARAGRATRAELSGSTITLSSLGALGGIVSTPVINRPEVAIVAVNRIVQRPVARGGSVVLRQLMNLSSSFDHRVVDGIDAARFVQALRLRLETPALLFTA